MKKPTLTERLELVRQLLPKWQKRIRDVDRSGSPVFTAPAGTIYTCRRELLEALGMTEEEVEE